ncbi:MAG: protein translocase subunit SecD, partial [Chloroflexi bacterium]|nr:protein translocase subunit SecD [Chloroflexota bacterium]
MQKREVRLLVLIVLITALAGWVVWPQNPGIHIRVGDKSIDRDIRIYQGLDLQGGMQVLLAADVPEEQPLDSADMDAAKSIVERRVNGLGVAEPAVQAVGSRRILVELPGIRDPQAAIDTLRQTGLMEWVDTGSRYLEPGTVVKTDVATADDGIAQVAPTPTVELTPTEAGEAGAEATPTETAAPEEPVYHTVLTGRNLKDAQVTFVDTSALPVIAFQLDSDGARLFGEHTAANVGKFLAIVLDKVVISCPQINDAITGGEGIIQGQFTPEQAQSLVLQLRYGSLPVPLKVLDTREVGPTLGADSVDKSIRAGVIGLVVVFIFMLVYYRLPGLMADLALAIYAIVTLALFKLIPVTLTLSGIAGFLLSVGMAVDANILIFERMREELRAGRTLQRAIEAGFSRAWTSILDSNISVWITCAILWFFGNSFGASVVKGFALTLALGVLVSIFTAVTVTRTFV